MKFMFGKMSNREKLEDFNISLSVNMFVIAGIDWNIALPLFSLRLILLGFFISIGDKDVMEWNSLLKIDF